MKRYVYAGLAFCLVLGFQNCAGNRQLSDMSSSDSLANPGQITPIEKIDVSQAEIIEVPESSFLESKIQADILQAKAGSNFSTHHLEIDVKTGVIHVIEDGSGEVVDGLQYCLNSQEIVDLNAILSDAKLCQVSVAPAQDQVCTMEYRFPYARLQFVDAEVSLGEAFSACQKGVDLCGEQKNQLQSFLGQVQMNLAAKKCEFQVVAK